MKISNVLGRPTRDMNHSTPKKNLNDLNSSHIFSIFLFVNNILEAEKTTKTRKQKEWICILVGNPYRVLDIYRSVRLKEWRVREHLLHQRQQPDN